MLGFLEIKKNNKKQTRWLLPRDEKNHVSSGIDKSTEWSTIPACPNLMCFFNRGDTEGTNSSKILCPMFVYVLFYVNLCHD